MYTPAHGNEGLHTSRPQPLHTLQTNELPLPFITATEWSRQIEADAPTVELLAVSFANVDPDSKEYIIDDITKRPKEPKFLTHGLNWLSHHGRHWLKMHEAARDNTRPVSGPQYIWAETRRRVNDRDSISSADV